MWPPSAEPPARSGCVAVPGMEITTEEEVHLVALMPDEAAAGVLHARVAAALPGRNAPDTFGMQVIANEQAEVLGFNPSLLSAATSWTVDRAVNEIHRAGGLAVAAHIDRERFGLVGQLGFVPPGLPLDAIEVSAATSLDAGRRRYADPLHLPAVTGSDAHSPAEIGRAVTFFHLDRAETAEVHLAIRAESGRTVLGGGRPMEDLALHILDIAQNGVEAGATRVDIRVEEDADANELRIVVADNGRGMDAATPQPRHRSVLHDPSDAYRRPRPSAAAPGRRGSRRPSRAWTPRPARAPGSRRSSNSDTSTALRLGTWKRPFWCCWPRTRMSISTGRTAAGRRMTACRPRMCVRRSAARRWRRPRASRWCATRSGLAKPAWQTRPAAQHDRRIADE